MSFPIDIDSLSPQMRVTALSDYRAGSTFLPRDSILRMAGKLLGSESRSPSTSAPVIEDGALNEHKEFIRWLYMTGDPGERYCVDSVRYPWPFLAKTIDVPLLLSYWHMTRFENWPGAWKQFAADMKYWIIREDRFYWAVATYTTEGVPSRLFRYVPKEFIDAFT